MKNRAQASRELIQYLKREMDAYARRIQATFPPEPCCSGCGIPFADGITGDCLRCKERIMAQTLRRRRKERDVGDLIQ